MKICAQCGMKTWDEAAEAVIEEAVRQARDRLR
jgi:N-methylhydantoinase B/oxoprolinase/acetone carboxylase alpha subunit